MLRPPLQPPAAVEGAHLVLYDGVCGLCTRLIEFLLTHDRRAVFVFASLQSAAGKAMVARCGGNPDALTTVHVVANYRTTRARILSRSRAALFIAGELGWPWTAAVLLRVMPAAILDRLYDFVARRRYRVFGHRAQCLRPAPEFRSRFIE